MSPPTILLVIMAAVSVAGCGRRGALEEPREPDAAATVAPGMPGGVVVPIAPNAAAAGEHSTLDPGSPGAQDPAEGRPVDGSGRFFLDPLI